MSAIISSLLLCVGRSITFSQKNKNILKSSIKQLAEQLLKARFYEVVAVLSVERESFENELRGLPVKMVHNEYYFNKGLHSAIKIGVMNINLNADYFAICLADHNILTKNDYNRLILAAKAYKDSTEALIICPTYQSRIGNPILISTRLIPEILSHKDSDSDCSYLFDRYPDQILLVEMESDAFIPAFNPEDYI